MISDVFARAVKAGVIEVGRMRESVLYALARSKRETSDDPTVGADTTDDSGPGMTLAELLGEIDDVLEESQ